MRWLLSIGLLLGLLLVSGCVQVPGDTSVLKPKPVPSPSVPDDQFAGVDEQLVARLLASQELRDPQKLRKYAALYRGMQGATMEPGVSVMQIIQSGMKTTDQFIKPRSPDIQAILKDHMPKPPLKEDDRQRISDAFASLGLACHAAAHRLEQGGK